MKQVSKRVAEPYKELKNITSKLHGTAESIVFIWRILHHEVTPNIAQVKGNFVNVNYIYTLEKCILLLHLNNHVRFSKLLIKKHRYLFNKLKQECRALLITAVLRYISTLQQKERMDPFKTKMYKILK